MPFHPFARHLHDSPVEQARPRFRSRSPARPLLPILPPPMDGALASENPWLRAINRDRLEREGHVRLSFEEPRGDQSSKKFSFFLPFAKGNFATPSGKAELYSESIKAQGLDPMVEYRPPSESRHGVEFESFPLELLARKADNFLNSTFSNLPVTRQMEEIGLLEMNGTDARARGIADGDRVRAFKRRGDIVLTARVDGAVQPGVVSAKLFSGRRVGSDQIAVCNEVGGAVGVVE